ncbi:MAG: hypothetical protein CMK83_05335 [Pseudomonadales bacterium]|jgi:predicted metal-dependent hydrolase|uniref:M48 family metallopeptidase n=1 Tax=unclassified Ketobacter TaxID=2639109 RepID=UPI000C8A4B3D|nr:MULTISPECIES: SprT family zinc-dependent metalloprotease [unclassified Ketobacter]MAA58760.1 hypothetical protein [Pseudomonadales bacterium]MEC8809848.1 SprT family zinc-dependent metalloprotease [Pseudomonadota bacterium]TNC90821.1 MAG: hypothetical protein CSH49_01410 [Alcanivorax sp.]HAG92855.1 hypothetical protein [Gammaproteobacteria bacterium]MAQ23622.1 hypothetical protein [Pseudomonadales bacterium]|tara:strand:+ start:6921 stop:7619 length:699 start_codon:yes stop_codon:yes gene_type:complete
MKFDQKSAQGDTPSQWTYRVKYARRKTIGIYVSAEQGVEVRVPHFVSRKEADDFVALKRNWIEKQLQSIARRPQRFEPTYRWGEPVYFLGEQQIIHHLDGDGVDIVLPGQADDSVELIERRVQGWFRQQALALFTERHDHWQGHMRQLNLPVSTLHIRAMKRRWGTCRSNGKIIINTHLARYPLNCVDVVIVHELCHLLEFNHSRHFYRLMDQAMPDWKTHDAMLNRLSLLY